MQREGRRWRAGVHLKAGPAGAGMPKLHAQACLLFFLGAAATVPGWAIMRAAKERAGQLQRDGERHRAGTAGRTSAEDGQVLHEVNQGGDVQGVHACGGGDKGGHAVLTLCIARRQRLVLPFTCFKGQCMMGVTPARKRMIIHPPHHMPPKRMARAPVQRGGRCRASV